MYLCALQFLKEFLSKANKGPVQEKVLKSYGRQIFNKEG